MNAVNPVLSATPLGGDTGGQTPVQPELTVQASEVTVSSESTYNVKPFVLTKPGEPKSVISASVVVAAGEAVALAATVGEAVGDAIAAGDDGGE